MKHAALSQPNQKADECQQLSCARRSRATQRLRISSTLRSEDVKPEEHVVQNAVRKKQNVQARQLSLSRPSRASRGHYVSCRLADVQAAVGTRCADLQLDRPTSIT